MKNIGIVCEGPTDFTILQAVIDTITGESNIFYPLQPEPDAIGRYESGWKGVLKWCMDYAAIKKQFMNYSTCIGFSGHPDGRRCLQERQTGTLWL